MQEQTIRELSVELTVAITEMCENITGKSVFKNQLLRSCSSIGANVSEAKYAQSRAVLSTKWRLHSRSVMKQTIGSKSCIGYMRLRRSKTKH